MKAFVASTLKPGEFHKITPADLPKPFASPSARNFGRVVERPADAWPKAPAGFKVEIYSTDTKAPRKIVTAPNGDFFVAESNGGAINAFASPLGAVPLDLEALARLRELSCDRWQGFLLSPAVDAATLAAQFLRRGGST